MSGGRGDKMGAECSEEELKARATEALEALAQATGARSHIWMAVKVTSVWRHVEEWYCYGKNKNMWCFACDSCAGLARLQTPEASARICIKYVLSSRISRQNSCFKRCFAANNPQTHHHAFRSWRTAVNSDSPIEAALVNSRIPNRAESPLWTGGCREDWGLLPQPEALWGRSFGRGGESGGEVSHKDDTAKP